MNYDIIGQCSIRCAAALRSPRCCSGHAATLPRLCRPGPALAEPLGPDPLRLGDTHHPGAALAVAPHPLADVHLVEPAAVAQVPLRVGRAVSTVHHDAVLPVVGLLQFYLDKCTILPVRDFRVSHGSQGPASSLRDFLSEDSKAQHALQWGLSALSL